jgi:hypothetical protein
VPLSWLNPRNSEWIGNIPTRPFRLGVLRSRPRHAQSPPAGNPSPANHVDCVTVPKLEICTRPTGVRRVSLVGKHEYRNSASEPEASPGTTVLSDEARMEAHCRSLSLKSTTWRGGLRQSCRTTASMRLRRSRPEDQPVAERLRLAAVQLRSGSPSSADCAALRFATFVLTGLPRIITSQSEDVKSALFYRREHSHQRCPRVRLVRPLHTSFDMGYLWSSP